MGTYVKEGITIKEILLLAIYFTEITKYWIGLNGIWNMKILFGRIMAASCIIYTILILCGIIRIDTPLLWVSGIALLIFLFIRNNPREDKIKLLKAFLIITCMGEIIGLFILIEQGKIIYEELTTRYFYNNIICIAALFIIYIIKKYNDGILKKLQHYWEKFIYAIVLLIALVLLLTISGMQFTSQYVSNPSIKILLVIISLFSFICVGLIGFIFVYIDNENKKIKKYLKAEQLLLKTQERFYEAMLAKENDTRRFRHDIINHMIYLNELAEKEKTVQIKEYIKNLSGYLQIIQNRYYVIGNDVLDAIINYYIELMDKDIEITVTGTCNCALSLSEVDLCSIISNLVQNSVEELNRQEKGKRYFKILFSRGEAYIKIEIINSIKEYPAEKRKLLELRQNNTNHGIGLRNAKETIEKNNGKFEISKKNSEFSAVVILPIQKT